MEALLRNVRDFIENWTFNVPSQASYTSILNALDAAILESEKLAQVSDTSKTRRKEIMRLMREDFDPTPAGWEGREWNDNAEDVADRIEGLYRSQTTTEPKSSNDETGWLVELKGNVPQWWSLLGEEPHWTADSLKALRFARKEDAEAYIADIGWTEAFASEHIWTA